MKIDGILSELRNIMQADRKAADAKQRPSAVRSGSDTVQISDRARTLKSQQETAVTALNETPDVRQARVEQVKARVAEGFYDRPEVRQAIADSILDSGVMEEVASEKRQVNVARAAVTRVPDAREDRVTQAKQRADSGFYDTAEVRGKAAEGLLNGML